MATVTVGGVTSQIINYQAKPVCTTRQLADFYACTEKNIADNFQRNADRFDEGRHFIRVEGEDLRKLKSDIPAQSGYVPDRAARLILWTEKGAARHAKMLSTDRAWDVFEALEESYFRPAPADPMAALNDPAALRTLLLTHTEKVIALEQKVVEDAPKVAFHDCVAASPDCITVKEAAQVIGTGQNRLMNRLRQMRWLNRRNEPYQEMIERGLLQVKVRQYQHAEHGLQKSITPMVTGRGLVRLQRIYLEDALA